MRATRRPQSSGGRPSGYNVTVEQPHRLHPSRRRLSDASVDKLSTANSSKSSSPRDPRPPSSMRGFNSIPPVPPIPLMQFGHLRGSSIGSFVSSSGGDASGQSTPRMTSSHHNSTSSLPGFTLTPTKATDATPLESLTPSVVYTELSDPLSTASAARGTPSLDFDFGEAVTGAPLTPWAHSSNDRHVPKTTRFAELEHNDSDVEGAYFEISHTQEPDSPNILRPLPQHVINIFPESEPVPAPTKSRGEKLLKGGIGGKLLKKNRTGVAV